MFDDLQQLRDNHHLFRLLHHYAGLGAAEAEAWLDRLMELEGVKPQELTNLHGKLLAFGWIEQNTGAAVPVRREAVPSCYRLTAAGRRAFRQAQVEPSAAGDEAEAA